LCAAGVRFQLPLDASRIWHIKDFMEVQLGEWVKTDSGGLGKVVHISRLTIFVAIDVLGNKRVYPFLESQLTRIDPLSSLGNGIVATAQKL
jgi:hypothetical protein